MTGDFSDFVSSLGFDPDDYGEAEDTIPYINELDWQHVASSNLAAVAWRGKSRRVFITFLDGSVYFYMQVPKYVWETLMKASSHGTYFYHNIRMTYNFERII